VVGKFERQPHCGRKRGLELPGLAWQQSPGAQAERVTKGNLTVKLPRLVIVARHEQGALGAEPDGLAAGALQLTREPRPHHGRAQPQRQQAPPTLAELDLRHGCQHAGGDARRSLPGPFALEQHHIQATLAPAPGDGEADNAGAHHDEGGCPWTLGHAIEASPTRWPRGEVRRPRARLRPRPRPRVRPRPHGAGAARSRTRGHSYRVDWGGSVRQPGDAGSRAAAVVERPTSVSGRRPGARACWACGATELGRHRGAALGPGGLAGRVAPAPPRGRARADHLWSGVGDRARSSVLRPGPGEHRLRRRPAAAAARAGWHLGGVSEPPPMILPQIRIARAHWVLGALFLTIILEEYLPVAGRDGRVARSRSLVVPWALMLGGVGVWATTVFADIVHDMLVHTLWGDVLFAGGALELARRRGVYERAWLDGVLPAVFLSCGVLFIV